MSTMYQITLYYNFVPILYVNQFCEEHKRKCRSLDLMGRVYIAPEGINGTLAGTEENILGYQQYLKSLPGFEDTKFKDDQCGYIPFTKLIVKTRPEIVTLKASVKIEPQRKKGRYLSPQQWREVLESDKDYILLDVRNNYESRIGHFERAIRPDVENFFDFEQWLDQARLSKDKKVLMYCTGGIRCEKFSILMGKKGYREVYQLQGGIIHYAQKEGGAHFKGKCFVFDDRLAVTINKKHQEPLSYCEITGNPSDTYINCANMDCNRLFICSSEGAKNMQGCCSEECRQSPKTRPFDAEAIFAPTRKWYHYFDEKVWNSKRAKDAKKYMTEI